MERKPLGLPAHTPTTEPKSVINQSAVESEPSYNNGPLSESFVEMWAASFKQESEWMIYRFPQHHAQLSQIILRPRQPAELFMTDNSDEASERIKKYDGYTTRDIEEFINMAVGVGSDVTAYENIIRFVKSLKTTRAVAQRLIDSLCVMSASSFAGQSGEYTLGAILDGSPTKIARNLPQLFDGYLGALAEFEDGAKFENPPEASKFVPNASPLMQDPLTRELVKKAFFNASVLNATMAPHIVHRGRYEQELIKHVSEAQKEGVVAPGAQSAKDIRGYMRASSKFAIFLEQASQVLLDPSHPHHDSIINSVREHKDHDMVEAILLLMCNADGARGVEALVLTKMQISFLASQDGEGQDVYAYLRDSIDSYIETYDIDTNLQTTPPAERDVYDIDQDPDVAIAESGERMNLFEAEKSTPKIRPQSEIGDMKRKMAKERRKNTRLTDGSITSEVANESPRPSMTKRLAIEEDDVVVGEQIAHLSQGEQAVVLRAIQYYREFGLGMRKIRSAQNLYRLRAGSYRVIFESGEDGGLRLFGVSKKSNSTYKEL